MSAIETPIRDGPEACVPVMAARRIRPGPADHRPCGVVRRARRIARDVAGDQSGIARAQFGRAEAEPSGRARREVLDEDIGLRQHGLDHGAVVFLLEIDAAGFLAAVQPDEIRGLAFRIVVIAACEVAFRAFELDDARAGIGELAGRGRHGHRLLQRHHQNSFERVHRRSGGPPSHPPSQTGRRSRGQVK